jgi:hypothetical protein
VPLVEEVGSEARRVRQARQRAIHEAGVAEVLQAHSAPLRRRAACSASTKT